MFCRVCVLRVRVWKSYRTCRSSGYGYGSHTELTVVPGRYTNVVPVPVPAPRYFYKGIPVPRVLCHGSKELTEVPGTGMDVVQTSQKFGYGYGNLTELIEVPGMFTNVVPVPVPVPVPAPGCF